MQDPRNSTTLDQSIRLPVTPEEEIPEFPAMKEKAPPVPPPVEQVPPPVPPPVDSSLLVEPTVDSDYRVQLPTRSKRGFNRRRRFPRRRMALVAAILVLFCFGLCSDDGINSQTPTLETTSVVFSEPASRAAVGVDSVEVPEPAGHSVEVVEAEFDSESFVDNASDDVEEEPVPSRFASATSATSTVARLEKSLPNRPSADFEKPVTSAKPGNDPVEAAELLKDEPEVCQLTIASERLLGTSVLWAETANEAAMMADDRGKLVYLIQVSGNFEIPEFT